MNNVKKGLLVGCLLALSGIANAGLITENFDDGSVDNVNFEMLGGYVSGGQWYGSVDRSLLRTVDDGFVPSAGKILTIDADLTMFGWQEIAYISFRSDGLSYDGDGWGEAINGLNLRMHNFQNGHTGMHNGGGEDYFAQNPASAEWFFDNPVHVNIIDNGSIANVTLTNSVTQEVNFFSYSSTFSGGGHVGFATSGGSSWDNIAINYEAVDAPEPASLALFGLGVFGLMASRKRKAK